MSRPSRLPSLILLHNPHSPAHSPSSTLLWYDTLRLIAPSCQQHVHLRTRRSATNKQTNSENEVTRSFGERITPSLSCRLSPLSLSWCIFPLSLNLPSLCCMHLSYSVTRRLPLCTPPPAQTHVVTHHLRRFLHEICLSHLLPLDPSSVINWVGKC